jgi:lysophospholipase L1-like esterase
MRRIVAAMSAVVLTLALAGPALAAPGASGDHAVHYYLSLGDSLAAGYQPTGDPTDMFRTDEAYTDQLYTMVKDEWSNLRHVKLGCPGETTTTFREGGICGYDEGSQLDQAVAFLHAHRQFVAFVTIDLGWNDFPCHDSIACLAPGAALVSRNLPGILADLRAAAGPDVPIVGGTLYDPFLVYWLQGTPEGQALARMSVDQAIVPIDAMVSGIYASYGMPVADVLGAFHTEDWTPVPASFPGGTLPRNVATVCALTWVCVTGGTDFHANADGYHVMALAWLAALGG